MARIDLPAVTQWISAAAHEHGGHLAAHLMTRLSISRRIANKLIAKLVQAQWLASVGTPRRPHHTAGALRQVVRRYLLSGLEEDLPWARDFAPFFALRPNVARLVQHAFTELLNNAVDHSGGTSVTVSLRQTAAHVQLLVSDDGRGIFDRIAEAFDIDDPATAMLELGKGKLTSDPERHSGRGLFFSSRLADVFDLHANARAFQQRAWDGHRWMPGRAMDRQGTSIYLAIALDTVRTLDEVLRQHSTDGRGVAFDATSVPLQLLTGDQVGLESRAQARRVVQRLGSFRRAELDFGGVGEVGHGFTDELFRVFSRQHPGVELVPVRMAPRVAEMVDAVRSGAA